MAKQSGLHQIRGKVGEHSYYRQSGVSAGLIRSINHGLSSRVKTSAEYANTRLNNAEFAAACNVAGLLGKMVTPKFRPMILPFSQSKMAKDMLELARQGNLPWGKRVVAQAQTAQIAASLTSTSKNPLDDFMSISLVNTVDDEFEFTAECSVDQVNVMASLGITGFAMSTKVFNLGTGMYDSTTDKIRESIMSIVYNGISERTVTVGESISDEVTFDVESYNPPVGEYQGHQLLVVVLLPYRTVGSTKYTLQEYCRFKAIRVER